LTAACSPSPERNALGSPNATGCSNEVVTEGCCGEAEACTVAVDGVAEAVGTSAGAADTGGAAAAGAEVVVAEDEEECVGAGFGYKI